MKSDCIYLFSETWNLLKISSVSSDFLSPALVDINSPTFFLYTPNDPQRSFSCHNRVSNIAFFDQSRSKRKGKILFILLYEYHIDEKKNSKI